MLRENCRVGMKITTVGDPSSGLRKDSKCCRFQRENGYLFIKYVDSRVKVGIAPVGDPSTYFSFDNVHPYFGGANNA